MAFFYVVKFDFINHINDLTEINTVFHIVVGVLKGRFHDCFLDWSGRCNLNALIENGIALFYIVALQHREQGIVDEAQKLISCHSVTAAVCLRPISPSEVFGNYGFVVVLIQFPIVFFGIIDFQEKHPYHLLNSLSIAVDTCVHAHNITDSFYKT